MFGNSSAPPPADPSQPFSGNFAAHKKKRRPAGTPDPDAEVVSLSPRTLLESERYVCEICSQGFQRDQNLQMHRRRHKVPWKLLKRGTAASSPAAEAAAASRKRVFVCPEPSCLHHDPCHALGDLVGIKKHFRRKHSANRQWACARCSKSYAVHSDYKAHLKTCGTRGHSCDCGRVFSRVEAFIEHQDSCKKSKTRTQLPPPPPPPPSFSYSASSRSASGETILGAPLPPPAARPPWQFPGTALSRDRSIELQLLPPPSHLPRVTGYSTDLSLSIAPPPPPQPAKRGHYEAVQLAERELAAARRLRQQAQVELEKACSLREAAARQINSTLLQITCGTCRQRILAKQVPPAGGDSFGGGEETSGRKSLRLD